MVQAAILLVGTVVVLYVQPPASIKSPAIEISGAVERPVRLDAAQVAGLPQRTITVKLTDGRSATFSGTTLSAILQAADVRMGESLKGARLSGFVLVEGADGYRAVFSLPELDSTFTDDPVILAMKRNGLDLMPPEGPFRVIVPKDKKQSRWIRQVVAIRLLRAEDALEE